MKSWFRIWACRAQEDCRISTTQSFQTEIRVKQHKMQYPLYNVSRCSLMLLMSSYSLSLWKLWERIGNSNLRLRPPSNSRSPRPVAAVRMVEEAVLGRSPNPSTSTATERQAKRTCWAECFFVWCPSVIYVSICIYVQIMCM